MVSRLGRFDISAVVGRATCLLRLMSTQTACVRPQDTDVEDPDMPTLQRNPYQRKVQKCVLCKYNIEPDYKNVRLLSQFQSRHTGRVYGRHITGLCKSKQVKVENEIAKAQQACLMGFMTKDPNYVDDPKLFDPNHPFKPHKY